MAIPFIQRANNMNHRDVAIATVQFTQCASVVSMYGLKVPLSPCLFVTFFVLFLSTHHSVHL